jgi:hypothetical protein
VNKESLHPSPLKIGATVAGSIAVPLALSMLAKKALEKKMEKSKESKTAGFEEGMVKAAISYGKAGDAWNERQRRTQKAKNELSKSMQTSEPGDPLHERVWETAIKNQKKDRHADKVHEGWAKKIDEGKLDPPLTLSKREKAGLATAGLVGAGVGAYALKKRRDKKRKEESELKKEAISNKKKRWAAEWRGVDPRMHKAIVLDKMTSSPKSKEHAAKAKKLKSGISEPAQAIQKMNYAQSLKPGIIKMLLKKAAISQEALESHVREGRHVSPNMKKKFGISDSQLSQAHASAGAAKTRVGKGFKTAPTKSAKGPIMSPTKVLKSPPSPVPDTSATSVDKPHPILSAIHMAKTHPDPAKRKHMEGLVRSWHRAKTGKTALAMLSQHHLDARAAGLAQSKKIKKSSLVDRAVEMASTHPDPEKRKAMADLVLSYRKAQSK